MIETDDDFQPIEGGYDFLVDFLDLSFPRQRPAREHAYLEVTSCHLHNFSLYYSMADLQACSGLSCPFCDDPFTLSLDPAKESGLVSLLLQQVLNVVMHVTMQLSCTPVVG